MKVLEVMVGEWDFDTDISEGTQFVVIRTMEVKEELKGRSLDPRKTSVLGDIGIILGLDQHTSG